MWRIRKIKSCICLLIVGFCSHQSIAQTGAIDLEVEMNEKLIGVGVAPPTAKIGDLVEQGYCIQPPFNELCAQLPHDILDFDASFVYRFLEKNAQTPFDIFSWETFVALNWPTDDDGVPLDQQIGTAPDAPRVWQSYVSPTELFSPDNKNDACSHITDEAVFRPSSLVQSIGLPLIDKNLNYVVFDIRVNDEVVDYVKSNGFDTLSGQQAFKVSGKEIEFPQGHFQNNETRSGGAVGSVAVKSAWKIIDQQAGDDPTRYYTVNGHISVPADMSENGKSFCAQEQLGLIGMHVMRRTKNGNGGDWIWTTFEHVDTAPIAANARRPNQVFADVLFPDGCHAPESVEANYALYDSECQNCPTNVKPPANMKWAQTPPYAMRADLKQGAQVVRCWSIFESTQYISDKWREKLAGTVWANYHLLSTQWKGARRGGYFLAGEVPRFLTNSTMETFEQGIHNGTCMGCHLEALSTAGQDSNFSFLLRQVSR